MVRGDAAEVSLLNLPWRTWGRYRARHERYAYMKSSRETIYYQLLSSWFFYSICSLLAFPGFATRAKAFTPSDFPIWRHLLGCLPIRRQRDCEFGMHSIGKAKVLEACKLKFRVFRCGTWFPMDTLAKPECVLLNRCMSAVDDLSCSGPPSILQIVKWAAYDDELAYRAINMLHQGRPRWKIQG